MSMSGRLSQTTWTPNWHPKLQYPRLRNPMTEIEAQTAGNLDNNRSSVREPVGTSNKKLKRKADEISRKV
jgi:hypothetical protein